MNIIVPHSWLRDYLETSATPQEIGRCLSLCGPSVEKIVKTADDWLYHLEITTNRPDCFSVSGLAREAAAILPQFQIPAKFINDPYNLQPKKITPASFLPLQIKIQNFALCPRFTAVVLENIRIKPSPFFVQKRLQMVGIRSLNNVIDVSNYLMVAFGQPVHTFDYDQILQNKIILREAQKGEKVITLDDQLRILKGGDIVIEDGSGRLIDLCGIMGAQNSAINENTKRVLLFVQTYKPSHIRKTSLNLPLRTEAAVRFEKGVDPQLVLPTIYQGIQWLKEWAGAKVASQIFDLYSHPYQPQSVQLNLQFLQQQLGVNISQSEVKKILTSLGFQINQGPTTKVQRLEVVIPSWRFPDVLLPQDLVEEVARLYGYHRLPSHLMTTALPQDQLNPQFLWEEKVKSALKHWSFTEVISFSLQSENLIRQCRLDPKFLLRLKNPLSEELSFLRSSLLPSLLSIVSQNQANFPQIKIFELGHLYLPQKNELPQERLMLTGIISSPKKSLFLKAKGIAEALFSEVNLTQLEYKNVSDPSPLYHPTEVAAIYTHKKLLGFVAEIHPAILNSLGITHSVAAFEINFNLLSELSNNQKTYQPIPQFPAITEDLCFLTPPQTKVSQLLQLIKASSSLIKNVTLIDQFDQQKTFRLSYQHSQRNLKNEEVKVIRQNLLKILQDQLRVKLKNNR